MWARGGETPSVQVTPPSVQVTPPSVQVRPPSVQVRPPSVQVRPPSAQVRPHPFRCSNSSGYSYNNRYKNNSRFSNNNSRCSNNSRRSNINKYIKTTGAATAAVVVAATAAVVVAATAVAAAATISAAAETISAAAATISAAAATISAAAATISAATATISAATATVSAARATVSAARATVSAATATISAATATISAATATISAATATIGAATAALIVRQPCHIVSCWCRTYRRRAVCPPTLKRDAPQFLLLLTPSDLHPRHRRHFLPFMLNCVVALCDESPWGSSLLYILATANNLEKGTLSLICLAHEKADVRKCPGVASFINAIRCARCASAAIQLAPVRLLHLSTLHRIISLCTVYSATSAVHLHHRITATSAAPRAGGAVGVISVTGGAGDISGTGGVVGGISGTGGAVVGISDSGGAGVTSGAAGGISGTGGAAGVISDTGGAAGVTSGTGAVGVISGTGGAAGGISGNGGAVGVISGTGGAVGVISGTGGAVGVISGTGDAVVGISGTGGAAGVINGTGGAAGVISGTGVAADVVGGGAADVIFISHCSRIPITVCVSCNFGTGDIVPNCSFNSTCSLLSVLMMLLLLLSVLLVSSVVSAELKLVLLTDAFAATAAEGSAGQERLSLVQLALESRSKDDCTQRLTRLGSWRAQHLHCSASSSSCVHCCCSDRGLQGVHWNFLFLLLHQRGVVIGSVGHSSLATTCQKLTCHERDFAGCVPFHFVLPNSFDQVALGSWPGSHVLALLRGMSPSQCTLKSLRCPCVPRALNVRKNIGARCPQFLATTTTIGAAAVTTSVAATATVAAPRTVGVAAMVCSGGGQSQLHATQRNVPDWETQHRPRCCACCGSLSCSHQTALHHRAGTSITSLTALLSPALL
ncbi:hypothetical protein FHG87_009490 [Trinorchestia longiramus]|nr:hypothetical protein FHG87_009490 [Trinorchestia longiramus]